MIAVSGLLLLMGCTALSPREEPAYALKVGIAKPNLPGWATTRINPQWWRSFSDPHLNLDIETAFKDSPNLQRLSARLALADAQLSGAKADSLPSLNLGYGFRFGRARDADFGPYNLAPWTGSAQLRWELDIFSKLKRARESAEFSKQSAFWDLEAARLVLASRIAMTRFDIYRLDQETKVIGEALTASESILKIFKDRLKAGLVSETEVHRMTAEQERMRREKQELERLRLLAEGQLDTLKGGAERSPTTKICQPTLPTLPNLPFDELICNHPAILAAEANVRAAYKIEEVARLDLLPSFRLNGSLMGASPHFFLDEFRTWRREIGPSLDIPIFEPERHANLKGRRARTDEAVATYRSVLINTIDEIDAAHVNLANRKKQLISIEKEVSALAKARFNVTANFKAGLVSQVELLESERTYWRARQVQATLEGIVLLDHLALIRAFGGGCVDRSKVIQAKPAKG